MKSGKTRFLLAISAVLLGLLLVGVAWFVTPRGEYQATTPTVTPAPELAAVHAETSSLRDLYGNVRSLSSLAGDRATVLAFLGVDCPLANLYVPRLVELEKQYRAQGVHFVAVYSHENETATAAAAHALERDIPCTVVKDYGQRLADSLGVTRTPTVCVLDPSGALQYRGRISDQYGVNSRRPEATREDLQLALDELLSGNAISVPTTESDGCLLDRYRAKSDTGQITYGDVAPILSQRCSTCHRAGQTAPFALSDYDDVAQWSKMIREVVLEQRMPPWQADPRYGHFSNDRSLSTDEIKQLVAWIDAGMPRGESSEEPGSLVTAGEWDIAEPDAVLQVNTPIQVPAEGVLSYDYLHMDRSVTAQVFDRDRWIVAAQLRPSNPSIVHHMTLCTVPPKGTYDPTSSELLPMLAAWAPGDPYFRYPPGTALRVPQDSTLMFEVHHVPNGVAAQSQPSVAFTFSDTPPEREVRLATPDHLSLKLAPGDAHYRAETESTFSVDTLILGLYPHAHFRAKSFSFEAFYPDGKSEILLSVPRFDFKWQTFYWLKEPKRMSAGTKLKCVAYYDNSRYNLGNPDPNVEVRTGSQATDEMMVGWVFMVAENPADDDSAKKMLVADRGSQVKLLEDELRTRVTANAEDVEARLQLAHALYSREQWDEARAELEEILRRDPKFAAAIHSLGRIAEKQHDDETAVKYFRAALLLSSQQPEWLNDLGAALVRLERYDEAIDSYRRGLGFAPKHAILQSNLAFALLKRGQPEMAAQQARAALAIEPDLATAHANLGLALADQEQFAEAATELRTSLRLRPDNAEIQFALGKCLLADNKPKEAAEAYSLAINLDPDAALAYSGRGLALAQQGKLAAAAADFRAAIQRNDSLSDPHFYLGQCLAATGKPAEAESEYRRALELNPNSAAIANNLAWLLATHPDEAVRDGAEAVRLAELARDQSQQEDPGTLDTLAAAYAEAGRFDDAVRTMQRVIEVAASRVDEATRNGMYARLKLYQSRQPYRETAGG